MRSLPGQVDLLGLKKHYMVHLFCSYLLPSTEWSTLRSGVSLAFIWGSLLSSTFAYADQHFSRQKQSSKATGANLGELLPRNLIQLNDHFAHHIAIAEKSTHQLHLFKNEQGIPRYLKTYSMTTGKLPGDKSVQGDHRTPEGIYQFTRFLDKKDLEKLYGANDAAIYGVGAFVMNYPNYIDRLQGKTGGGIWLHSTNDESRLKLGLDSRGCVVLSEEDIKDFSQYIELGKTPLIIVQNLFYLKNQTWQQGRHKLEQTLNKWLTSWQENNFPQYIGFYDAKRFRDGTNKRYTQYKVHKRRIFRMKDHPRIEMKNLTILTLKDYAVVQFIQDYQSTRLSDQGKKTLYLAKDDRYNWKIVHERWSPLREDRTQQSIAFIPSMRYFKEGSSSAVSLQAKQSAASESLPSQM